MDLIIESYQIKPAVINLKQYTNNTRTLIFTLDTNIYDNINLAECDAYAVSSLGGFIDETKLVSEFVDGILKVIWQVMDYTTLQAGTVTYQIVFKKPNGAVWYSYEALMIISESIAADQHITANYATILRQWEDRVNTIISTPIKAVEIMPRDETIPIIDRINGRLYFQLLDNVMGGRFENERGNILNVISKADVNSPTFTGSPQAPTPGEEDDSTRIATTGFAKLIVSRVSQALNAFQASVAETITGIINSLRLKADIDSQTFTGVPRAPTPAAGDDSTRIATTEFVQNMIDSVDELMRFKADLVNGTVPMNQLPPLNFVPAVIGKPEFFHEQAAPANYVIADGRTLSDAQRKYPDLWNHLKANPWKCRVLPDWNAISAAAGGVGGVAYYVIDEVLKTIKVMDLRNDYFRSYGSYGVGAWNNDAIRNITGTCGFNESTTNPNMSGAFRLSNSRSFGSGAGYDWDNFITEFNASWVVPTAQENRPRTIVLLPCIYVGKIIA